MRNLYSRNNLPFVRDTKTYYSLLFACFQGLNRVLICFERFEREIDVCVRLSVTGSAVCFLLVYTEKLA